MFVHALDIYVGSYKVSSCTVFESLYFVKENTGNAMSNICKINQFSCTKAKAASITCFVSLRNL